MKDRIDIVDIKNKVKNNELEFYIKDGIIYCKDKNTEEIVSVGKYTEIKINNNGIIIVENGKYSKFGYEAN